MLEFCDELAPQPADGWPWGVAADVVFAASLDLGAPRCVGCFVEPARTVLGLRAWDDVREGPTGWAVFEVEKFVRMALRQSGLAFEALVAPATWSRDFDARAVAQDAVTTSIFDHYRDVAYDLESDTFATWRWRSLLTGVLLATRGQVSLDLPTLCRELGASNAPDAAEIAAFRHQLPASTAPHAHLPDRPGGFDRLNDLVVALRSAS